MGIRPFGGCELSLSLAELVAMIKKRYIQSSLIS
jgi:hypothetical protein